MKSEEKVEKFEETISAFGIDYERFHFNLTPKFFETFKLFPTIVKKYLKETKTGISTPAIFITEHTLKRISGREVI